MKAIHQHEYGEPDVLALREVERPVVGGGEALVRVHAASVNPGDWHLVRGEPYLVRLMGYGLRKPKQHILGQEIAGRVEAVGAGVTQLQVGDEVFGWCTGAFAEYACVREDRVAPKPARLTFEQAAAVPGSAFTALQALRDAGEVQSGQRVLILGASGGVGTFAVQIAKTFGAEVTGVCSARNADRVRAIGADHVIDYATEDFAAGGQQYDVILYLAGNRSLSDCRRALTPEGTLVLVGGKGGRWLGGVGRWLRALAISPFVRQNLRPLISAGAENKEDLLVLAKLVEAGKLTPVIDRTLPLAEATEAIRYVGGGHARGKVVLTV